MPTLIMVCGPNGGGKSTLTNSLDLQSKATVIDPDKLAVENGLSPIEAGKEASRQAKQCIKDGESFARESTLSGNFDLKIAKQAKENGFRVELFYSGLDSAETAISRVQDRVAKGGHNVPEEDIKRRYERSLQNLPEMIELADCVTVYDNTDRQTKLVLSHEKGKPLKLDNPPEWLTSALRPEKSLQHQAHKKVFEALIANLPPDKQKQALKYVNKRLTEQSQDKTPAIVAGAEDKEKVPGRGDDKNE